MQIENLTFDPASLCVLIVDDHPQMRKAILQILKKMRFDNVLEASDGSEAIAILKDMPVDFVILDLYMREVSGFEVLENVRNRIVDSDVPIIVVTGEASKEEIIKSVDLGANDYLLKPFQTEDLEKKVVHVLTRYHSPDPLTKMLRKAERLIFERNHQEAAKILDEALAQNNESVQALYLRALTFFFDKDIESALELIQKSINLNQDFYRNYALLADIYLHQDKVMECISAMQKELEFNPKQPTRQVQVSNLLLSTGNTQDAIKHLREALKENVRYAPALIAMGQAYAEEENLEKALYYYKRWRRYYPQNTKPLEAIVKVCFNFKDEKKAEYILKDEKNVHPNRLDTYLVLAKLFASTDRISDGIAILNEVLIKQPEYLDALRLKANILIRDNQLAEAIETYRQIIKKHPDPAIIMQYCDLLTKAQAYSRAIVVLHKLLKLNYDKRKTLLRLAYCYYRTDEIAKAYHTYLLMDHLMLSDPEIRANREKAKTRIQSRRVIPNKSIAS